MRLLQLSEIKTLLQELILNTQTALFHNVKSFEDYCRLSGKLEGIMLAIAALEDAIKQEDDEENF